MSGEGSTISAKHKLGSQGIWVLFWSSLGDDILYLGVVHTLSARVLGSDGCAVPGLEQCGAVGCGCMVCTVTAAKSAIRTECHFTETF